MQASQFAVNKYLAGVGDFSDIRGFRASRSVDCNVDALHRPPPLGAVPSRETHWRRTASEGPARGCALRRTRAESVLCLPPPQERAERSPAAAHNRLPLG